MVGHISNVRPKPDQALVDIADYVTRYTIKSAEAYEIARYFLILALSIASDSRSMPTHDRTAVGPPSSRVPPTGKEVTAMIDPATPPRKSITKIVSASLIGTTIEWYDFFLYGSAAALVFNKLFFPTADPLTGTMLAFTSFAIGFMARPWAVWSSAISGTRSAARSC